MQHVQHSASYTVMVTRSGMSSSGCCCSFLLRLNSDKSLLRFSCCCCCSSSPGGSGPDETFELRVSPLPPAECVKATSSASLAGLPLPLVSVAWSESVSEAFQLFMRFWIADDTRLESTSRAFCCNCKSSSNDFSCGVRCRSDSLQVQSQTCRTWRAACLPGRRNDVMARPSLSRVDFSGCLCGGAGRAVLTGRTSDRRRCRDEFP